tara:strand:- start:21378 stop:22133 length:756 start_codon:yes stop_codon:yes gene_type:complete
MKKDNKHTKSDKRVGFSSLFGIAVAFILLGLAVFAGFYMEKNTYINSVEFNGTYYADDNELLSAIDAPIGLRADSVRFDSLFEQLKSVPYVKDVSVKMSIRGKLTFLITEHQPVAMLVQGAKRSYMSEGGVILPIVPEHILNVPLVYGIDKNQITDSTRTSPYWKTEEFLLAAQNNDIGWATISEVAWTDHEGIVALTHENGVKLIFGQENFEEKMNHWKTFYSEIISRQGIQSFEVIDLRFRDQIVTRNF